MERALQEERDASLALRGRLEAAERSTSAAARALEAARAHAAEAEARGNEAAQQRDEAREALGGVVARAGAQGVLAGGPGAAARQGELQLMSQQLLHAQAAAAAAREQASTAAAAAAAQAAARAAAARELEGEQRALLEARRLLEGGGGAAGPGRRDAAPFAAPAAPWAGHSPRAAPAAGAPAAPSEDGAERAEAAAAGGAMEGPAAAALGVAGDAAPLADTAAVPDASPPSSAEQGLTANPPLPLPLLQAATALAPQQQQPRPPPAGPGMPLRAQSPQPSAPSPLEPGAEPSFGARSTGSVAGGRIAPEAAAALRALGRQLSAVPAEVLRAQQVRERGHAGLSRWGGGPCAPACMRAPGGAPCSGTRGHDRARARAELAACTMHAHRCPRHPHPQAEYADDWDKPFTLSPEEEASFRQLLPAEVAGRPGVLAGVEGAVTGQVRPAAYRYM